MPARARRLVAPALTLAALAALTAVQVGPLAGPSSAAPVSTGSTRAAAATTAKRPRTPTPPTYYVSPTGSDAASGTSPDQAFATLGRVSRMTLAAGTQVLLRRGATYTGTLGVQGAGTQASPIVVDAWGTGTAPVVTGGGCVQVGAAWTTVRNLVVDACTWTGVDLAAPHALVTGLTVSHNISGIKIEQAATSAVVRGNTITDNDRMAPGTPGPDDDYGAFGVEVLGDGAEIASNRISGGHAWSADYGQDGSAIEVYGAQGTSIHHNLAWDNQAFSELGDPRSADTRYAYNVVRSDLAGAAFLVTRGGGDAWGPVARTTSTHDSVRLTGAGSMAFWCGGTCGADVLSMRDDVLVAAGRIGWATAPTSGASAGLGIGGGENLYWGSGLGTALLPGDRVADPLFASTETLALAAGSPAIDRASSTSWPTDATGASSSVDGDGDGVAAPDLGAMERAR